MVNLTYNEEKIRRVLTKFPHGVKAKIIMKDCSITKTPLYIALNRLRKNDLAFRGEHGLWYPQDPKKIGANKQENISLDELKQLKEDYLNGFIDKAFKRVALLLASDNGLPKNWKDENEGLFSELIREATSLDEERKIMRSNPIEQGNFQRQKRIQEYEARTKQLKAQIIFEALKHWT